MNIKLRLFATLRENRGREVALELPEGTTVGDVLERVQISKEDVAILLINGRDGSFSAVLSEGDRISLFPPVGGG